MSNYKDDIRDDEIRVIGTQQRKTSPEADTPPRRAFSWKALLWMALLAVLLIIGLLFFLRQNKLTEDPYDGVFEPKEEMSIQSIKAEKKTLGHEVDSLSSYTEKIDTVINDVLIAIYIPHNATPELIVGKPSENDPSIILAAQAADIRADNKQILGAFVDRGTPLAWGLSKKGYCSSSLHV